MTKMSKREQEVLDMFGIVAGGWKVVGVGDYQFIRCKHDCPLSALANELLPDPLAVVRCQSFHTPVSWRASVKMLVADRETREILRDLINAADISEHRLREPLEQALGIKRATG